MIDSLKRPIIVYGRPFCGMIAPIRKLLRAVKAPYEYVDIYLNPDARDQVAEINNGSLSVPTLVFPDGSILTEPSVEMVKTKLKFMGFKIESLAMKQPTTWDALRSPVIFFSLMAAIYLFFHFIETV